MNCEPGLECPKCHNAMEVISAEGGALRLCPACATLAWITKDGIVGVREPEEVTGEEKRKLLENMRFTTVEAELARLRRSKNIRDNLLVGARISAPRKG